MIDVSSILFFFYFLVSYFSLIRRIYAENVLLAFYDKAYFSLLMTIMHFQIFSTCYKAEKLSTTINASAVLGVV